MERGFTLKIIAFLSFLQGLAGILRAFNWVQVGVNLFGDGLLLLPLLGMVSILRGLLISVVALLYFLFTVGAMLGTSWARPVGLTAAIINLLLVLNVVLQGASFGQASAWSVIPVLLVIYLISESGRKALKVRWR